PAEADDPRRLRARHRGAREHRPPGAGRRGAQPGPGLTVPRPAAPPAPGSRAAPRFRASVTIPAPPDKVWRDVERLETHVEWMADAESIEITSERRQGLGTTFECVTKVGPIRLTDRMEVVEWTPGRAIGVRHDGIVSGTGRFTL